MSKKYEKYLGSIGVESTEPVERKTPLGSDLLLVKLANGVSRRMPKKAYETLATDEQSNAEKLQSRKFDVLIEELLYVMGEYDVTVGEAGSFFEQLRMQYELQFDQATHVLYGGKKSDFAPGMSPLYNVGLLDAWELYEEKTNSEKGIDTQGMESDSFDSD